MNYVIDGYNLMHFLGLVRPPSKRALEKSRQDLQDWLRRAHGQAIERVTLVFDGQRDEVHTELGLRIQFSAGQPADDLIEEIIKRQTQPQRLTVISSDRRIQEAARRKGCVPWSCSEYVDWVLDQGHEPPKPPRAPEKPPVSAEETEHWLKEFADLDNDPELKRFNRMYKDFGA